MSKKIFTVFALLLFSLSLVACGEDTAIESISVDPESVTIEEGETVTIDIDTDPVDIDDLTWASEDDDIATVSDGEITGVSEGETTVTVSKEDVEASVDVTVTEADDEEDDNDDNDDDDDDTDDEDTIAPIITVDPSEVSIEFGETYDLLEGVSALDNEDGNITDSITMDDDDDFDSMVPGEYTVEYSVEDAAGNKTTETRTVTVNEQRLSMTISTEDGDDEMTYPVAYNPELYYRDQVNTLAYPREKVTVFEADYYDWLVDNQPGRIFAGWSVVMVLDGESDVHITRDYVSNQTNADGSTGPAPDYDWCSGSPTGGNDEWCTHLGMVANIDVPEDGHVVVFPNGAGPEDDPNGEDSPRYFGANYFSNTDYNAEDRIGMQVTMNNVTEGLAFDADEVGPTLDLDSVHSVSLETGDDLPDLMEGVSATDDLDVDISRVWYYDSENEEVVIDEEDISTDDERTYYVRYHVEDSEGRYDQGHRLYQVTEPVEDTENEGTIELGNETYKAIYNFSNFADEYDDHEDQAYVLSKEFLLDQIEAYEEDGDDFQIQYSVLAATDAYGNVLHYRHLMAHEISEDHAYPGGDGGWTNDAQMDQDLLDAIPADGYLVVFPNSADNEEGSARFTGVEWLYHDEGDHTKDPNINPLEQRFYFSFDDFTMEEELGTIDIGGEQYDAVHNVNRLYDYSNIRTGFDAVHVVDRDYLEKHMDLFADANDGSNIVVQYSFLVVVDENGAPLVIRNVLGTEVRHDDQTVNDSPDWTNTDQLDGILDEIPEGGQLLIFPNGVDAREFGGETLWNEGPVEDDDGNETETWRGDFTVDAFDLTTVFIPDTKYVEETGYMNVDGESYEATKNLESFFVEENIGTNYPVVHWLERDYLDYGLELYAEENEGATKIVQYSFVVALDEDNAPVAVRNVLGQEVTKDDPTVNDDPEWGNNNQLEGILDDVPEDGSVLIFHNGENDNGENLRDIGGNIFWNDDTSETDETWRNSYDVDAFSKTVEFDTEPITE